MLVERPSGFVALDYAAQRALLLTRLPELPPQFPNPSLTVHVDVSIPTVIMKMRIFRAGTLKPSGYLLAAIVSCG